MNQDSQVALDSQGFINFFSNMPVKSETTIRFFCRNDFYTVHGADALFVAKKVFKSTNNIKFLGSEKSKLESLALNKNQFEALIKDLLLVDHYRVEVYTSKGGQKNNEWNLEYKGSPGNLDQFEDIISSSELVTGAAAMAIKISGTSKSRVVGVAVVEISERSITVSQFEDDENFTELEGFIVQIGPKEIIIPDSADYKNVMKLANRSRSSTCTRKPGEFTMDGLASDLNRLLHWKEGQTPNSSALPEMKLTIAASALNAAVRYLELTGNEINFNQFTLSTVEPNRFVHIDTSSAKALGLIETQSYSTRYSLISFLDKCRTPQGRRLLSQWVKQPLKDIRIITERQDILSAFMDDPELRMALHEDHLRRFPDLQLLSRKLQRKNSSLQECYKIYQAVERIQPLIEALKAAEYSAAIRESFIDSLNDLKEDMSKYQEMISSTLDMESVSKGEFLVKPDFSEELGELKGKLDLLVKQVEAELAKCARDLGFEAGKSMKLETTSQIGYHFRITNKREEKTIRDNFEYKIIDATKAGVRFQSKKLADYNEDYLETKKRYDECQRSIVEEIINISASYVNPILSINNVIAKLDVLISFALTAANAPIPYVRPVLKPAETGIITLKQTRHPILEVQESMSFIPNDFHMNKSGTTFYIITGPNMGGKSTFIRTIGINVLLAHIGAFVPCEEAEISVRDAILARIGAGDCQLIGVSTFMNEMIEMAAILRRATSESLVMIDELGRGTSTYEGCGLAWAIAKHLAEEKKSFTLFATHFQELTTLPEEISAAANYHVTASTESGGLTLLYKLAPGASDRSFGLEVARMAGFQEHVIERAKKKLLELEQGQGLGITGVELTPAEIKEGEKMILDFLCELKQKGLGELDRLRKEISKKNHPYINAILS